MPIFKINDLTIYFCHIPKSGGTTVLRSLEESGVSVSFSDQKYWRHKDTIWYKSSPQHILQEDKAYLFREDFFDYEFSIIRDPVERFLSAYNHNRPRMSRFENLDKFLTKLEEEVSVSNSYFGRYFDNHFVPASRFISKETKVFYLSDGLDSIFNKVGQDIGLNIKAVLPQNQKRYNEINRRRKVSDWASSIFGSNQTPKPSDITSQQNRKIRYLYEEDYACLY